MKTAMIALATVAALATGSAWAEQNINQRLAVPADAVIEVTNIAGWVKVTGWDRSEVELVARLEGDSDKLEFNVDGRHVDIEVKIPKGSRGDHDAELTLRVPRGAELNVHAVSADVSVTDFQGRQRLESVSGAISTVAADEDVSLNSVSGDVTLAGRNGRARATVNSVSGNIDVSGISGEAEVNSVSGDQRLQLAMLSRGSIESVSGNVLAGVGLARNGRLDIQAVSGDVVLRLGTPVNAEIDVESFSGDIDGCFGPKARSKSQYGPGKELRFTQGDGAARVKVETLSGDVRFCDK
jgi:hypothetical protein